MLYSRTLHVNLFCFGRGRTPCTVSTPAPRYSREDIRFLSREQLAHLSLLSPMKPLAHRCWFLLVVIDVNASNTHWQCISPDPVSSSAALTSIRCNRESKQTQSLHRVHLDCSLHHGFIKTGPHGWTGKAAMGNGGMVRRETGRAHTHWNVCVLPKRAYTLGKWQWQYTMGFFFVDYVSKADLPSFI